MPLLNREPRAAHPVRVPRFRESATGNLLLDYHWLPLWLALSLAPVLLSGQQTRGRSALGLRVTHHDRYDPVASPLGRSLDLTYRYALDARWSAEVTAGFWRGDRKPLPRDGGGLDQRITSFRAEVSVQREWGFRDPALRFYGGLGLGILDYGTRNRDPADGSVGEVDASSLSAHLLLGLRYDLKRVPLELDVSLRPSYGGRGIGLDLQPSVAVRYRFGGRER